jgi:hypothetical protein
MVITNHSHLSEKKAKKIMVSNFTFRPNMRREPICMVAGVHPHLILTRLNVASLISIVLPLGQRILIGCKGTCHTVMCACWPGPATS